MGFDLFCSHSYGNVYTTVWFKFGKELYNINMIFSQCFSNRIAALHNKIAMYHEDMEKDREQNTQLIDSLRAELQRQERLIQSQATDLRHKETAMRAEKQKGLHES